MSTAAKRVFITGGRRGIGRGIAYAFAETGADVVINDIVEDDAVKETLSGIASRGGRGAFVRGDVAAIEDHARLLDAAEAPFGGIDVLVNNAGVTVAVRGDMLNATPESFDRLIAIDLRAPFFLNQAVAKRWLAAPAAGRSVITISSANVEIASPARAEYCIAKSGLAMMTKLFALRLAEAGIGVYEIRPGIIETEMTAPAKERYDRLIAEGIAPIRRWGPARGRRPRRGGAGQRRLRLFGRRGDPRRRRDRLAALLIATHPSANAPTRRFFRRRRGRAQGRRGPAASRTRASARRQGIAREIGHIFLDGDARLRRGRRAAVDQRRQPGAVAQFRRAARQPQERRIARAGIDVGRAQPEEDRALRVQVLQHAHAFSRKPAPKNEGRVHREIVRAPELRQDAEQRHEADRRRLHELPDRLLQMDGRQDRVPHACCSWTRLA
jgi:NAD(P)-dependent dehydrogenase (short-subunit alcohol dehydrogenase family)